jgi:hypothetical protein
MKITTRLLFPFLSILAWNVSPAQKQTGEKSLQPFITFPAGAEYKTSSFHQWLWGTNYRREWYTPVKMPVALLDTLNGGTIPKKAGGGHQTKSLHSENLVGKKYTLRSVNKTLGKVLPEDFLGTFIEDIVDDKVSMSHPYAAASAAYLAERANVYHTNPSFVYLPKQRALDSFPEFGEAVYLFEQKIDGDWKEAKNLGNFDDYISTFKVLDSMYENNSYQADQQVYVRSRLFDMLINDWDRHEDQWEWGAVKKNGKTTYRPLPQDRDQAFFKYNGVVLSFLLSASGMKYFQPFGEEMRDVKSFNFEQRNLDRFFTNQLSLTDWQAAAKEMQQSLTDNIVDEAIKQMPPEIQGISGSEIASKLKGRRDRMVDYATIYYKFIAKEVDVVGSKAVEHFQVKRINDNETEVKIYASERTQGTPFYSRTFTTGETEEIRLYGLSGHDTYNVEGADNNMKIRLIGGYVKDSITVAGSNVHVYDNRDNVFNTSSQTRYHLSNDSSIHEFKYAGYTYDKKGIAPIFFFSDEDRFFVGLAYGAVKHKWRNKPFAYRYNFGVNYSLSQKAFSVFYNGLYPNAVGKWNLALLGNWDAIRWTNFFGLGNESKFLVDNIAYYRARTEEWLGKVGLQRTVGHSNIRVNGFFQSVRVLNDEDRFTGKEFSLITPNLSKVKKFAGGELLYTVHNVNDSVVPTKGVIFFAKASYLQNVENSSRTVTNFKGVLRLYVPLLPKFSLDLRAGGETVSGKPEFYQYASIGGGQDLRGFRGTRFWGKTAFFNSNELRFINNVKSYLYNGKLGLVAFYDNGRVWMPNEKSDKWHHGYGGGILLAPFNKISADVTYGISDDDKLIQLRLTVPIR